MMRIMKTAHPYITTVAVIVGTVVMIAMLGIVTYRVTLPPLDPPVKYTAAVFPPEKPIYAPGETLRYTPTLILRSETEIGGHRFIMSATTRRIARLCDGTPARPIPVVGGAEEGTEANIDGGAFVPILIPKLPPGDYWVRSFVHGYGESSGQATYRVFFSVREPC